MKGNVMLDKIKNNIQIGFGKKETSKTAKGAAVGGVGAIAYSVLSDLGVMPLALSAPDVVPYVVAGLSAIINSVRQFFTRQAE
tara:strand:- start:609 stop:857 length:249 start_codon:yes stop_codon:yes gene_type:complete